MNRKDFATFVWAFDRKVWGESMNTNQYLGTLSLLFIALLGAYSGGGTALEFVGAGINANLLMVTSSIVTIWAYNVAESITGASNPMVAASRIILFSFGAVLAFALGVITSVVVVAIVALFVCAMLVKCLFFKGDDSEEMDK